MNLSQNLNMSSLDIDRLRADTPTCKQIIHFNNAGASLMPTLVYRAMADHLKLEQDIGGYEAEAAAADALSDFYDAFASLLNCDRSEIAYVENATRAWDMAFYSLAFKPGDRILTGESEFVSNFLAFLHQAQRRGLEIDVVPCDSFGQIDVDLLAKMITPRTRLLAITHVPTQGGLVNPVEEIGRIAGSHGIPYLVDACQSVGQTPLDVKRVGCQMLTGTGRKYLRGPRATGFLYVSKSILDSLDPPFIDMHAATWNGPRSFELMPDSRRFENWEMFVAGRIGLRAAVRYSLELGVAAIRERVTMLAEQLRERLSEIPGVSIHDLGRVRSGAVTFISVRESPHEMLTRLRAEGINVSVSQRTSAQLDFGRRGLSTVIRASIHCYNTLDEIEAFCRSVRLGAQS